MTTKGFWLRLVWNLLLLAVLIVLSLAALGILIADSVM